ncbi:MAG: NAD(P)-dependent alcohol dehydrogenase [Planctomycetota bacterium]|jgi:NADPH:quinone reductase-like Zn-dependent oxidoreductase
MKAVLFRRFGGSDVLEWADTESPRPKPGEIRVRVRASSINPVEWEIREGRFTLLTGRRFPMIAGHDLAGEVDAVGEGATRFRVGERVFAMRKAFSGGAHAELAVVPEVAATRIPEGVATEDAGVVPLAALTAWQALHQLGGLATGQHVLINGASGGVGTFAIQLARVAGAEVTAVCSQANADLVRRLGASNVIDYRLHDPTTATGFDLVLDAVARLPFAACRRMLTRGGVWVCTRLDRAYLAARLLAPFRGREVRLVTVKPNGRQLEQIGAMMSEGTVVPVVEKTFPITKIADAQALSAAGHVRGKIAIVVP